MFNEKDILARLQNGENVEAIAKEMTEALNTAASTYEKEKAEKEAAEKLNSNKIKDLQSILDLLHDFCIEYYCEDNEDINTIHEFFNQLTATDMLDMIEEIGVYATQLTQIQDSLDKLFGKTIASTSIEKMSPEATIDNFLKSFGLK